FGIDIQVGSSGVKGTGVAVYQQIDRRRIGLTKPQFKSLLRVRGRHVEVVIDQLDVATRSQGSVVDEDKFSIRSRVGDIGNGVALEAQVREIAGGEYRRFKDVPNHVASANGIGNILNCVVLDHGAHFAAVVLRANYAGVGKCAVFSNVFEKVVLYGAVVSSAVGDEHANVVLSVALGVLEEVTVGGIRTTNRAG